MDAIRGHDNDFPRTQFLFFHISQIQIGKAFEGYAIRIFFFPDGYRSSSKPVPRRIDSLWRHQKNRHGTLDQFLRILNAFHQIFPLIDDRRYQFRSIDIPAAHFQEMRIPVFEYPIHDLIRIIDFPHRLYCISSMMGTDDQRLRLIIGNTADPHISFHLVHIFIKFGTERRVLNIMYGTVKPFFSINCHSGSSRPQMGMIVRPEKQIKHAIVLRRHSKKSTHTSNFTPFCLFHCKCKKRILKAAATLWP